MTTTTATPPGLDTHTDAHAHADAHADVRTVTRTTPQAPDFASTSVPRHLARGALGFGLVVGAVALVPVAGPVSLLAAPLALIAFRGCPTCWAVGLAQTISRGRLERQCVDGVCTLAKAHPHPHPHPHPGRKSRRSAEAGC
ncbi:MULTISPECIES: hypothetical protein [unclassified Streptomyces]|uniref:hypothetical protein n=1 Tax=unclassified Streptomyces TaxID=2593676 RepID=UPI001F0F8FDA|nr:MULTISPECIES: hypothetical protein [unclassified Streptomyces]